jgi:hypothetical protein
MRATRLVVLFVVMAILFSLSGSVGKDDVGEGGEGFICWGLIFPFGRGDVFVLPALMGRL